jgi:tetratricopeptide (TPR) repeat protein
MRALLILLLATPAFAQPTADDRARAKTLFDDGSSEYRAGHYDRAIDLFQDAYKLSHAPGLLFNIAQAYRLEGACAQALEYYQRSLDEDPAADNRAEMQDRVVEMQACVNAKPPDPAPPPPPPVVTPPVMTTRAAAEPPPRVHRRYAPLVTTAAGAAVALTGAILYWRARVKFDEVEPTCPCPEGSFSGWEKATTASYVMMGAGALAAAGGLVFQLSGRF